MPGYCELATASNFSFLHGASHPEELVVVAKRLGLAGIGIADKNTVAGVVRAHMAAKQAGLAFQPGCRLVFDDDTPDVIAYPVNRKGWGNLCRLLTTGNMRGEKAAPILWRDDLLEWGEDLAMIVMGQKQAPEDQAIIETLHLLRDRFGENVRLGVCIYYDGLDERRMEVSRRLYELTGASLIAVGDIVFHTPDRRPLADVLTGIKSHEKLHDAGYKLAGNAERFLKPPDEMERLFRHVPDAVAETERFFSGLDFSLDVLRYEYPEESCGQSATPQAELARLAWEGAAERYGNDVPERVAQQINYELDLIDKLEYAPYFLTVHDIVRFARKEKILCQGRGSAANSTLCFCIGITEVDPILTDLLFERFISSDRGEPPDIDVDFEHERREEVIQYIYKKYGRERAGIAATVITYRARSAAREVAKTFGLSEDVTSAISGSIWGWYSSDLGEREAKAAGLDLEDKTTRNVLELSSQIMGFPRHLSQHVGGFVITRGRLDELVPITKAAMEDRTMVEWDKDDLDSLGILKIDILALGMLSCLRKALDLLAIEYDRPLTLATMPKEDENVYDMICRADTLGVFQIESRAQMSMLPRLRPRTFYDLVIEVAIVRPGPIQGDMVHPYLRRRQKLEPVSYPSRELEQVLSKTLGVPLFQEQAMKIAIVAAGFSPGEADKLRRAMATFRRVGTISTFQRKMVDGMVAKGYEAEFAERCFKQIEGFGEYGFPESHAASFALLVYASCWLKTYYPDIFCAAMLNSQPMGFYAPAQLIRDACEHGVDVRPVDINASGWDCTIETPEQDDGYDPARIKHRHQEMRDVILSRKSVRLGFRQIKGLSKEEIKKLIANRKDGYDSVRDLWFRSGLARSQIERLADGDAFRSLGLDRRAALWAVRALDDVQKNDLMPLFDLADRNTRFDVDQVGIEIAGEENVSLPPMLLGEHVVHDYRYLGFSLKAHPVSFFRDALTGMNVTPNTDLDSMHNGMRVTVAGVVLVRQRPGSAKGVIFITLEDETGVSNVIVWPKVFEKFRPIIMGSRMISVTGKMQSEAGVIHIVADQLKDLTPMMSSIERDGIKNEGLARADEVRTPVQDMKEKTKPTSRLVKLLNDAPELTQDFTSIQNSKSAAKVLPKGRNFH